MGCHFGDENLDADLNGEEKLFQMITAVVSMLKIGVGSHVVCPSSSQVMSFDFIGTQSYPCQQHVP